MAKQLKVYSWTGHRPEAYKVGGSRNSQTREFMAAYSVAEVMRAAGMTRTDWNHSGGETGNDRDVAVAMANPGRVFWYPLNDWEGEFTRALDGEPFAAPKRAMTARRLIAILQKLPADQKDLPLKVCGGMGPECVDTDSFGVQQHADVHGDYLTFIEEW